MTAPAATGPGDFSGLAEHYERGRKPFPEWVFEQLGNSLRPFPWPRILDLGCGTGISTRQVAQYLSAHFAQYEVIGVDKDEGMLKRAQAQPLSHVWYRRREVGHLSSMFERGTISALTAFSAFHWFGEDKDTVRQLIDLLAPRGCFLTVNNHVEREVIDSWPQILEAWTQGPIRRGKHEGYDPAKQLSSHGLRVHAQERIETVLYTHDEALAQLQSSSLWNYVPHEKRDEAREVLSRCVQDRMRATGSTERQVRVVAVLGVKA